jgi:diacylglycerol kinase
MDEPTRLRARSWRQKFKDALRGTRRAVRRESSFFVHLFAACAVLAAALALGATLAEWCLLVLCICGVLTAEMFNTAFETLAKAVDREYNPHLRDALDMGSGAVLLAALGASAVGAIIFIHRLASLLGW